MKRQLHYIVFFKCLTRGLFLALLLIWSNNGFAQKAEDELEESDQYVLRGNEQINNSFVEAEKSYRMALSKTPSNSKGSYNLGTAYYGAKLYDEALSRLVEATKSGSKTQKHRAYHNIGNALMQGKECKKAVEAYKNALRNDPSDDESRYNLALAQRCAKDEGNGGDDNDNQEEQKQKDNKENEEKKDSDKQQEQEEKNKKKDKEGDKPKDDEDKKEENESPKDKNGDDKNKEQPKPDPRAGKMSPQQIKNLLEAMNNEEKKAQEKMNASKKKGVKIRTEKDW